MQTQQNIPKTILAVAAILLVVFILGLLWLAGVREQAVTGGAFGFMALLAFAAGLSMIVLPCTLPLVFVIVPLAAGKEYKKGFFMALLFGLGLTITITAYGVAMAYVGKIFGIAAATPWLLLVAGIAAYVFGLSELGIFRLRAPFFSGALPQSLQQKGDYIKSFLFGLLLGNAGVGCPNPLFYVLLLYIAGTADVASGALLGFIHGAGRALPIILLTVLALLGMQATKALTEKRLAIEKFTAWLLILIGAFLVPAGAFNVRGWWIAATPLDMRAAALAIGLLAVPLIAKFFVKNKAPKNLMFMALIAASMFLGLAPGQTLANGGDQRIVGGTYLINLSRSPFTPRAGVPTSFLASFATARDNKLISEDLIARVRIAKPGGGGEREFIFERDKVKVQGGIFDFEYTFARSGLHEIFFDFAFVSSPEKVYEAPDFLLDVQEPAISQKRNLIALAGAIAGFILGALFGLAIKRKAGNRYANH